MASESGWSNQKKYGDAQYKTIQGVGSDRFGISTAQMYLYDKSPAIAITASLASDDKKSIYLNVAAHGADVGDIARVVASATLVSWEYEIVEIVDANIVRVINSSPSIPTVGDQVKICRWITAKADSEGALTTSPGPAQFTRNSVTQTVTEDTGVPANNRPMPSGMFIKKDGVEYPVTKDTATPSNTVAIPVEIVSASGSTVTINAGDISIQTSHLGANFDSMRIGDGTDLMAVNADGSLNIVPDAATNTLLTDIESNTNTLLTKVPNTLGQQNSLNSFSVVLSSNQESLIGSLTETAPGNDTASSGMNGRLQRIAQNITSLLAPLGALTETAPASDTASSGLNGRLQRIAQRLTSILGILPAARGINTSANSLGVVLASDQAQIPTDANAYLDISGSAALLNAFAIAATDVSKYKEIILAISGTYTGILTFQGSNDNTNWFSVNGSLINTGTNVPTQFISGAAGMFKIPAVFKYFRVQMTSYTSGTAFATALATSGASTDLAMKTVSAAQSGTWNIGTVASITAAVTTASQSTAGTVTTAQITVGTSAVRATVAGTAPNAARKLLLIKPLQGQNGKIWIGGSGVTIATGMEIVGPDRLEFDFDAGDYFLISDTAGMTVEILEKV